MFKSPEEQKAEHKTRIKELRDLITQWKDLENQSPDKVTKNIGELQSKTNEIIEKVSKDSGLDDSVKKTLLNIKIGIKDLTTRLRKPVSKVDESILMFENSKKKIDDAINKCR